MKTFLSIPDANTATGLSAFYLRSGCKDGTIPYIRSGKKYMIDMEAFLEQLHIKAAHKKEV